MSARSTPNLTAPILLTGRFLRLLKEGSQSFRNPLILMVTSVTRCFPLAAHPYSATKAGLRAFTRALRYQLEGSAILRVVETLPPFVDTPLTTKIRGHKMSPAAVVETTLRAIDRGRDEVFVGQVALLPWLMRLAPGLAARLVAKSRLLGRSP